MNLPAMVPQKLVTLVVPESAEEEIVAEIRRMGVGVSLLEVRGKGKHGVRPDPWHGGNIEIRAVMGADRATRLLQRLEAEHLPTTNIVAWVSDVEAWPASRFSG
ncbi:MAG: hypothetical protein IPF92_22405 [Myxococcales bacterium]|nr:hypothetical protein [Myxococcales bacterium]MBL0194595.1 hypothetical protein [Myxococcales bacterium]